MKKVTTLRVGICSCSSVYRGRLEGLTVEVARRRFRLQEVDISEGYESRQELKQSGCHFFVDTHVERRKFEVELSQIVFTSNGRGRGWKLYIGGVANKLRWARFLSWQAKTPPPPNQLTREGFIRLLTRMDPKRLEHWLQTTTPKRA